MSQLNKITGIETSWPTNPPLAKATVDLSVSTEDKIPSYRICALEIKLILLPMYGVPPAALMLAVKNAFVLLKTKNLRKKVATQSDSVNSTQGADQDIRSSAMCAISGHVRALYRIARDVT